MPWIKQTVRQIQYGYYKYFFAVSIIIVWSKDFCILKETAA